MMLHFVRHLPADAPGLCYGWSDVALTKDALAAMPHLAMVLADLAPSCVITSDLTRCLSLAQLVADIAGVDLRQDRGWRERCFGQWELQRWDDIHAADPAAIDRLLAPAFAPPGGESLSDLRARVELALAAAPDGALIVAHGGPIAIARALLDGVALRDVVRLLPASGETITIENRSRAL